MDLNRKNMQKIVLLILFTALLLVGLQRFQYVLAGVGMLFNLIMPFVIGGALAFIVNVPMRFLEKNFLPRRYGKRPNPLYRMRRVISLVLTLLLIIALISILVLMVVPEMARSFVTVGERLSNFPVRFMQYVDIFAHDYPEIVTEIQNFFSDSSSIDWKSISETILGFFTSGNILNNTFTFASSVIGSLTNFFIGLVFAIYLLLQKERLGSQLKRILYSFLPERKVDRFLEICQLSSDTFSNFISGQCLEACILGLLFFISMTLLKMPYALIIAMLIGVLALVPIFGSFLGCAIGVFLIFIVSPIQALWFLILFLILQQIEGNLIYPHVVGNSVGLPSIWVLVAVTLGASTMGVLGMIINIPLFSILYTLLRQAVQNRLKKRKISPTKLR